MTRTSYLSSVLTELASIVQGLRAQGGDTVDIEAKSGAGGVPDSLTSSLSALANLPGGGLIILGLNESLNFAAVPLSDIAALKQALAAKSRAFVPPVLLKFFDAQDSVIDGIQVIAARVAECPVSAKPCRVAGSGKAYIRAWDGDYEMTVLEERAFLTQREHPHFDQQPVPGARRADLDPDLVALWTATVKELDRQGLGRFDADEQLVRGGVIKADGTPTVAGTLALGTHPQQFFPRYVLNLAAQPDGVDGAFRARNLATLSGPIPVMLDSAMDWASKTFDTFVVERPDGSVHDRHEYPLEAFRELIGNALVHRDLASWSEGLAIEVRLLKDRLVVTNPGGLYGINVARLGQAGTTSARNARLLEICKFCRSADGARVVETLATGIPRVLSALRRDQLPPPLFQDTGVRFAVVLRGSMSGSVASPTHIRLEGSAAAVARSLALGPRTVAQLIGELAFTIPNTRKILRRLMADRVVLRNGGPGKPTDYRLNPNGPPVDIGK